MRRCSERFLLHRRTEQRSNLTTKRNKQEHAHIFVCMGCICADVYEKEKARYNFGLFCTQVLILEKKKKDGRELGEWDRDIDSKLKLYLSLNMFMSLPCLEE